jgi:putative hydrolase of the HAD superfamily
VSKVRAVLLDVFDTVLTVDFDAALEGLVAASGLTRSDWVAGVRAHGQGLMTGALTPHEAFTDIFRLAGKSPVDVESLVRRDLELLRKHASVYPDVVPFMEEVRGRGMGLAFVSNCAPNAGPLLNALGLLAGFDHVVLSCDVGSAMPDPGIYRSALEALRVDATQAVFVDDQAAYCSGAEAVGMTAVRIDRRGDGVAAVRTLTDVLPML